MSDINISNKLVDKLTETLNKSFKNTNIFEKIKKIESVVIGIGLCMSFISIVTIHNFYSINNIKHKINNKSNNESNNESNNDKINNKSNNESKEF